MQTRESNSDPSNNFTVLRIKRNILNNSDLGGIFINRDSSQPDDYNRTFGIDLNFRFWEDLSVTSFLAATRTPDLKKNDMAGRVWVEWKTNLWEARTGYLSIGENFNPEVGFVPRRNIQKSDTSIGWRPRPESISWIREFFPSVQFQYITDQEGDLVTRETGLTFKTNFNNGGSFEVGRTLSFERLDVPFRIYRDLKIAAGDYHFNHWSMQLSSNPSANISGRLRYGTGDFWNGTRKGMLLSLALKPHYKFSVSSQLQWTHLKLKGGDFTTRLFSTRIEYAFSTKRFLSALIQYNSDLDQISTNLRFNLIHRPLSDIFVVYTEQRDVSKTGALNKSLMFKYTHMLNVF